MQKIAHFLDSDLYHGFKESPSATLSLLILVLSIFVALFAPYIAPHDTLDMAQVDLMNGDLPPMWMEYGEPDFIIGTDDQGRDLLSAIMYGIRLSFTVAIWAVLISLVFGVTMGLLAGYYGGWVDMIIMRIVDIQLSLPAILLALLISGIAIVMVPPEQQTDVAMPVLIIAIAIATWVNYARTVRSSTLVQMQLEYIESAKLVGFSSRFIMIRHILPNVSGPILVIGTIDFAVAILFEASLSFLGVGLPPTMPSLGTLIRVGSDYLFSGQWWVVFFSAFALFTIAICVNLVGDRLRDILNPKIQ